MSGTAWPRMAATDKASWSKCWEHPHRAKADLGSLPAQDDEGIHLVGGGRLLSTGGQYYTDSHTPQTRRACERGPGDVLELSWLSHDAPYVSNDSFT
jgi:hypothetical protein